MTLLKQTVGSWVLQGIQSVLYVFLFTARQLPKIPGKPILTQNDQNVALDPFISLAIRFNSQAVPL